MCVCVFEFVGCTKEGRGNGYGATVSSPTWHSLQRLPLIPGLVSRLVLCCVLDADDAVGDSSARVPAPVADGIEMVDDGLESTNPVFGIDDGDSESGARP